MGPLSRRSVLVGAVAVGITGCTAPSLQEDDVERGLDDDAGDEAADFDARARERVLSTVADAVDVFIHAADLLAAWEADPAVASVADFDDLRSSATGLLNDYDAHVLPYRDRFDDPDIEAEWDADGAELADLVELHESFLFAIEEVSIAIADAEADPDRVAGGYWDTIDYIVENGQEIAAETNAALGEA